MNKKNVQRIILGVMLAVLLVLCGCGAKQSSAESNKLVGKWYTKNSNFELEHDKYGNRYSYHEINMLEFYENGKIIAGKQGYNANAWESFAGNYVICDDETIILYFSYDILIFKFQISGNTLKLWNYSEQDYKDYNDSSYEIIVTQFEKQ